MTMPERDEPQTTRPIGVAMIGLGNWSYQLGHAIRRTPQVELIACYTRTPEKRERFAATFSCANASTLEELLNTPSLHAVLIAAPAHVHTELTVTCARHGLHVFVEKPMTVSLDDALLMSAVSQENGVVLMVGHEMRRLGSVRAMKQLVQDGALGQVVSASAAMTLSGRFEPDNWRCHRDSNRGGALMQLGIHPIENLNYLFGRPERVQGAFANAMAPGDVDDVGAAIISYEGGVQAVVNASYVSPSSQRLSLYGTRANLHLVTDMRVWPDAAAVDATTELVLEDGVERRQMAITPRDVLVEQMVDFAESIRRGGSPETGPWEGLMAIAVVEAALRSAAKGGAVHPGRLIDELTEKGAANDR